MDKTQLASIFLVAALSVIGNILYFQYKFKKEGKKEILKLQLTDLLLPIYFTLKKEDLSWHEWFNSQADPFEYEAERPKRLLDQLIQVIRKNLYLADEELHAACLTFLEWAYRADPNVRFDRVHGGPIKEDQDFEEFKKTVYVKYLETKNKYLED